MGVKHRTTRHTQKDSKGELELEFSENVIIGNSLTSVNTSVDIAFLLWTGLHEKQIPHLMMMQNMVRGGSGLQEMAYDSLSSLTSFVTQSPAE